MRVLICALLLLLTGCQALTGDRSGSLAADPGEPTPVFEPISLIVTPTPWSVAPLPTAEAARVFVWPAPGKPSLIFVYDDAAT